MTDKPIRVIQNWPSDRLRIEIMLGNVCNYKCWYCFPGSNEGTHRWPDYDLLLKNLTHLLDHYTKSNKKVFELHIIGGEPTMWPKLGEFCTELKSKYDIIISISSNGSRTLRWWQEYGKVFDKVILSCHSDSVDISHYIQVADCLYEHNVFFSSLVLIHPNNWDECMKLIDTMKKTSKHSWPIFLAEVLVENTDLGYSESQKKSLRNKMQRLGNIFWLMRNAKHHITKVKVEYQSGLKRKLGSSDIILERLNNFTGWKCNLGVDSIYISKDGVITGTCNENLYELPYAYNIYDTEFDTKFNPVIQPTVCTKSGCWCHPEANLPKYLPSSTEHQPRKYKIFWCK